MKWSNNYSRTKGKFRDKFDSDFKFKAGIKCKKLTLILPSQEAKAVPPITPILGQAGVNAGQFCLFFNKATLDSDEEPFFPLNVEISILGTNRFGLNIKNPSISLILNSYKEFYLFEAEDEKFTISSLYKIFLIKNEYNYVSLKSSFGTLRTFRQRPKKWIFIRMCKEIGFRKSINERNKLRIMNMWRALGLKERIFRNARSKIKDK